MWNGSWNTSGTIKKKIKAVSQSGSNVKGKKHIENIILLWKLCATLIRSLLWQHTVKWSPDWNLLKVQLWTLLPFRCYHVLLLWSLLWCFMQKHLVHTHLATGFSKPQPGRRTNPWMKNDFAVCFGVCEWIHVCFEMIWFALPRGSVKITRHLQLCGAGGQLAPITVFQLQVCTSNLKFLLVSEEARPKPHVCSKGALCLATLTPRGGGGSSDKHGYMAFLILAKWEWQVEDLCRPDNASWKG